MFKRYGLLGRDSKKSAGIQKCVVNRYMPQIGLSVVSLDESQERLLHENQNRLFLKAGDEGKGYTENNNVVRV